MNKVEKSIFEPVFWGVIHSLLLDIWTLRLKYWVIKLLSGTGIQCGFNLHLLEKNDNEYFFIFLSNIWMSLQMLLKSFTYFKIRLLAYFF
jgi:hypothetical protein